jgi:glycosyltransferase involved in cell wall biosynthesis
MYDEIFSLVARMGLQGRVHFTGFVADDELPALYSAASAFAFPSWYEGFGLPILEAMACGTPVVAADNSSLTEVVGDAGLLVTAGDVDALADALGRVLTDHQLVAQLVPAGIEQARRFTWSAAATKVVQAYEAHAK